MRTTAQSLNFVASVAHPLASSCLILGQKGAYGLLGPKEGGNATSPLHSRGPPTPSAGITIRGDCLTPAFMGAQKRAEMLLHPCILGGPQRQAPAAKSEVATSPLAFRGPLTSHLTRQFSFCALCRLPPVHTCNSSEFLRGGTPLAARREED